MTLAQLLTRLTQELTEAGIDGAARDLRRLAAHVLDVAAERVTLHLQDPLTAAQEQAVRDLAAERASGRPVSRLIGKRLFWGRWFEITDDVLDPRPETETLIAEALQLMQPVSVLDLGTGSGAIAVTLAAEWSATSVTATDLSPAALAVAARNADRHGVIDRFSMIQSDWYQAVTGQFDLIVSNPPYIAADEMPDLAREVLYHDPRMALTDEGDGLSAYRWIAAGALHALRPGGHLLVEIGWQQGADVAAIFDDVGLRKVRRVTDLDGRDRVICAQNPA